MTDTIDPKQDAKEQRAADRQKAREGRARVGGQITRAAKVATNVSGVGARMVGQRFLGLSVDQAKQAEDLKAALGGLKGPLMKIAQMMATIPEAVPEEYAKELGELQSNAPAMGWRFVKRRMRTELGADWQSRFAEFGQEASAAASLGQVHKAKLHDGRDVAVKLQYPDMLSAVESDLKQLALILRIGRSIESSIDTREVQKEIADRLREELDYQREAKHMQLYRNMFADERRVTVPEPIFDLTTTRLLTMEWLQGTPIGKFFDHSLEDRNEIAKAMFAAWWGPFARYGTIHGDPHLGNYTIRPDLGINLLDYGCIRIFSPDFVEGAVMIYRSLQTDDVEMGVEAYRRWGFTDLTKEMIEVLRFWSRFILGPMLDDRVRTIAFDVNPKDYGRKEAEHVRQALKRQGTLTIPKEFVFMDRATVGLGSVFLHLGAEMNWYRMFNEAIDGYDRATMTKTQADGLAAVGLSPQG